MRLSDFSVDRPVSITMLVMIVMVVMVMMIVMIMMSECVR